MSAHADKEEAALAHARRTTRRRFVAREAESAKSFGRYLQEKTGWEVMVPEYKDEVVLD